jgi:magnesium transporter
MENKHDRIAADSRSQTDGPVIAAVSYVPGEPPKQLEIQEIGTALLHPEALVWVGLHQPDEALLKDILRQLGMNEDALDILMGDIAMPGMSMFDRELLIVLPTIIWKSNHSRPHFGRLACLFGDRFLVTVRRGPSLPHFQLRDRMEKNRSQLERGCDNLVVEIVDDLIDRYVEAYKHFEVRVDRTERELMRATFDRGSISRLYLMRRDFHRFHVAIEPIGEICARVSRLKAEPLSEAGRLRFDGLSDRITRLDRLFDSLGDGLTFAFEAGMLIEQSRQTDTTRKLAAWAAIISIPTAVAGIYGMNFENMPELKWEYGYYAVLGLMATVCTTLFVLFKRAKWL